MKNKYGSGHLRPDGVRLNYRGRTIHAKVYGAWIREDGQPTGAPMDQHYDAPAGDLSDWPDWLAGLAVAARPAAVPVAVPPTVERRDRYAQAISQAIWFPPNSEQVQTCAAAVLAVADAEQVDVRAAALLEGADALGRMDYDTDSNDYGYDTYRDAWNGGVMDGADLLRRLATEGQPVAVLPQPETQAGPCDVEFEGGGHCSKPAGHRTLVNQDPHTPEVVHGCPPDGSGLIPCCGRTPFELPHTDRMSTDPAAVTCAPAVVSQPDEEA